MAPTPDTSGTGGRSLFTADCHAAPAGRQAPTGSATVALVGCPNVGKSAVFRMLTGIRAGVGNYPGTTVDVGSGAWRLDTGRPEAGQLATPNAVSVLDLPGTYSLDPISPDEELVRDVLDRDHPDLILAVVDAVNLSRSLYLVAQLRESARRIVVVLTMTDVAARRGIGIDASNLARALGTPVVVVDGRRSSPPRELAQAVLAALLAPPTPARQVDRVEAQPFCCATDDQNASAPARESSEDTDQFAAAAQRFSWIALIEQAAVTTPQTPITTRSDRIDRFVCNRWLGPILFLTAMFAVFMITTKVAAPLQEALGSLVDGPVTSTITTAFGWFGADNSAVAHFVVDGVIAGVGAVLTFIPLMILMFGLLAMLEDSGYLARAAVVADRLMRAVGLPGRAFIPVIVGFGCNVPAVAGTRVIPNARHRLLTVLLLPFVSCNARLTVYVLVATTFFGGNAGYVVFAMYVLSVVLVVAVGRLLRSTVLRDIPREPLMIDLPPYHVPALRLVGAVTWQRLQAFLKTATGIIVITSALVWILSATPGLGTHQSDSPVSFDNVSVSDSVYGQVSRAVAPAFDPAGFGNWQAASALITGFVAKEAVIAAWAQTYATSQPADVGQPGALGDRLRTDFGESSGGHTIAAVLAFMVFLLAYTPCLTTVAAQRREVGTRWTVFGIGMQLVVAWVLAVAVFQVGSLL